MNEEAHWNKIGNQYNDQIFDVFASDRKKRLNHYFNKHRNLEGIAIDFGCGNGKAFKYLSPRFKHIFAADISEKLLIDAASHKYKNVDLIQRDLTKSDHNLPKADFIFSCNVIMLPDADANQKMFENMASLLKRDASALLVVPATESMMFTSWMLTELYRKENIAHGDIDPDEFRYFKGRRSEIASGIFYIDGVPTRHYTSPELEVITASCRLKITALERLEYNWDSELADPPKDLKAPYPWDWLVECKKR